MANSRQARKRARQAVKHRAHNTAQRSMMRTFMKRVQHAIDAADKDAAHAAFKLAEKYLDRFARKGLIHKNKAARHKSRLIAKIKAIA